jgi:hypothetical protein
MDGTRTDRQDYYGNYDNTTNGDAMVSILLVLYTASGPRVETQPLSL